MAPLPKCAEYSWPGPQSVEYIARSRALTNDSDSDDAADDNTTTDVVVFVKHGDNCGNAE